MRFVDHDDVCQFSDTTEALGKVTFAAQVRMAEDGQVAEVAAAADVGQPFTQVWLPDAFLGGLGRKEDDALALVQHEALDQHQPHEGLAEADAVAEERAAVLSGDLHERPVSLFLVTVDPREHLRARLIPFGRGQFVAAKELLQCLGIDIEREVLADMAIDGLDDCIGDIGGFFPMRFEPLL